MAGWAAAAQAAGSIIGGVTTNIMQSSMNRRAQKRAHRMNLELWNLQNEYNDPSAQMQRLKNAGLNPNLIYGTSPTSAVGNAGAPAAVKPVNHQFDNPLRDLRLFTDLKKEEAQTDNFKTQNTVLAQEAALKAAQTATEAKKGKLTGAQAEVAEQVIQTSVDAAKEGLRRQELDNISVDLDNQFKDEGLKDRLKLISNQAAHSKAQLTGQNLTNSLRALEIELKRLGIERNDPWYFRIIGRHLGKDLEKELKNFKGVKTPQERKKSVISRTFNNN